MGFTSRLIGLTVLAITMGPSLVLAESDSKTVQVTATILPRLELTVTPEMGHTVAFGAIEQPAPGDETERTAHVSLNVFSNPDQPYHVSQLIRHPLRSTDGAEISETHFRVRTHTASRGQLALTQPTPIISGQSTTLYTSNERGKGDTFSAEYTLTITPETPAGDFTTDIVYTVTSL